MTFEETELFSSTVQIGKHVQGIVVGIKASAEISQRIPRLPIVTVAEQRSLLECHSLSYVCMNPVGVVKRRVPRLFLLAQSN